MNDRRWRLFLPILLAAGCTGLPRDQFGWTERIRNSRVLVVGVSREGAKPTALEAREKRIVETVARRLGARVEWRPGNAHDLLQDLEERKLPLVAATVPSDSPFAQKVGMSQPYVRHGGPRRKDYCLGVAPGENRIIAQERDEERN